MLRKLLLSLCAPGRADISQPFAVDWGGDQWDCATNGRGSLMLRGATWSPRDEAPDLKFLGSFSEYEQTIVVRNLLEYSFGAAGVCGDCDGESFGESPEGDECLCGCDQGFDRVQCGSIGGVIFNRRILYQLLLIASFYAPSEQHEILWLGAHDPIFIRNTDPAVDMLIGLMPMAWGSGDIAPIEDEPGMGAAAQKATGVAVQATDEVGRLRAEVVELRRDALMACTEPTDSCCCDGCRYAADYHRAPGPGSVLDPPV